MAIPTAINLQTFEDFRQEVIKACTIYPLEPESLQFEQAFRELVQNTIGDQQYHSAIEDAHKTTQQATTRDQHNAELLFLLDAVWGYLQKHPDQDLSPGQLAAVLVPAYERHKAEIAAAEKSTDTKVKLDEVIKLAQRAHISNTQEFAEHLTATVLHPDGNISDTVLSTQEALNLQAGAYVAEIVNNKDHTPQKKTSLIQEFLQENHAPQTQAAPAAQQIVAAQTPTSEPFTPRLAMQILGATLSTTATTTPPQSHPITELHSLSDVVDAFAPLVPFSLQPGVIETFNTYKAGTATTSDETLGKATLADILDVDEDAKLDLLQRAQSVAEREDTLPEVITQKTADEITNTLTSTVEADKDLGTATPQIAQIIMNEGGKTTAESQAVAEQIVTGVNQQANSTISDEKISDFLSQPTPIVAPLDSSLESRLTETISSQQSANSKAIAAAGILAEVYGIEKAAEIVNQIDFTSPSLSSTIESVVTKYTPSSSTQLQPLITQEAEAAELVAQIRTAANDTEAIARANNYLAQKGISDPQNLASTRYVDTVNSVLNEGGSANEAQAVIRGLPLGTNVTSPSQIVEVKPLVNSTIEATQIASILAAGGSVHDNLTAHFAQTLPPDQAQQAALLVEYHTANTSKIGQSAELIQTIQSTPATRTDTYASSTPSATAIAITAAALASHVDLATATKIAEFAQATPSADQNTYFAFAKSQFGLDDKSAAQISTAVTTIPKSLPNSLTDQSVIANIISAKVAITSSNLPIEQQQKLLTEIDKVIPTGHFSSSTFSQVLQNNQITPSVVTDLVTQQSSAALTAITSNSSNTAAFLKEVDSHQKDWGLNTTQIEAIKTRYVASLATDQTSDQIRPLLNQIPGLTETQNSAILASIEKTKSQIATSFTPDNLTQSITTITSSSSLNLTTPQQQAASKIIAANILTGGTTEDIRRELGQIPNISSEKIAQIATSAGDALKNQTQPFVAPPKLGLLLDNIDLKRSDVGTTVAQTQAIKKIVAGNIGSNSTLAELRRDLNQVSDLTPDQADKIVSQVDTAKRLLSGVTNNQVVDTFAQFDAKKVQLGFTSAQAEAAKTIMAGGILSNKPASVIEKELNQIPGLDTKKVAAAVNLVTENAKAYQPAVVSQITNSTGLTFTDRSILATGAAASASKIDLTPASAKNIASIVTSPHLSSSEKVAQIASSINISKTSAQELLTNTQLVLAPSEKSTQNIVAFVASRNNITLKPEDRTQIANLLQNPTTQSALEIKTIISRYSNQSDTLTTGFHSAYESAVRLPGFTKKTTSKIAEAVNTARKSTPDLQSQKNLIAKEISKITGLSSDGGLKLADQLVTNLPPLVPLTRQRLSGFVQQAAFPDRPTLTSQSIKKFSPEQRLTFILQNELKKTGVTPAAAKILAQNSTELRLLLDSQINTVDRHSITLDFFRRNGLDTTKINPRTQQIMSSIVPRLARNELSPGSIANLLQSYEAMSPAAQRAVKNLFQGKNFDLALQQFLGRDIAAAFQKEGLHLALPAIASAAYQTDLQVLGHATTQSFHFRNSLDMSLSYLQQKTPQGTPLSQKIIEFRNRLSQTNTDSLQRLLSFKNPLENPKILMDTFTGKARGFFNYITNPTTSSNNVRWFQTIRSAFSQRDLRVIPETLIQNFGGFARQFRLFSPVSSLRQRAIITGQNSRVFKAGYARIASSRAAKAVSSRLAKTAAGRAIKGLATRAAARILGGAAAGSALGPVGTAVATAIGVTIEVARALWNPIKKGAKYAFAALLGLVGGSTVTLSSAVGATAGFAVAGPAGAVVGGAAGGAVGGATQVVTNTTSNFLQSAAAATGAAITAITAFTVTNAGLPLAISSLVTPIIVAFFLFIINAGGYIVPTSGILTSTGDIVSPIGGGVLPDDPSGDTPRCWPLAPADLARTTISQGPEGKTGCTPNCSHDVDHSEAIDLSTGDNHFPVYATHNGVVTTRDTGGADYGKSVLLTGPAGINTIYAHLFAFAVVSGTHVGRGTLLGYTDSTGHSTGPHLHYEIVPHPNLIDSYVPPYTVGKTPTGCSAATQGDTVTPGSHIYIARGAATITNVSADGVGGFGTPQLTCEFARILSNKATVNANYFKANGEPVGWALDLDAGVKNFGCGTSCATKVLEVSNTGAKIFDLNTYNPINPHASLQVVSGTRIGALASDTSSRPRTIAGLVGSQLVLAVFSSATNAQLTQGAQDLGITDANGLELDGGGSSTFCDGTTALIGNTRKMPIHIGMLDAIIEIK